MTTDVFGRSWNARRVSVIGLGKSGLAAAQLLHRFGCCVRVTEAHDTEKTRRAASILKDCGVFSLQIGEHSRSFIEGSELLVVSPGIPENALVLQWAHEMGLPVISEIELAFYFCRANIIAVTGTNGKSTAVTLITELLRASRTQAIACGNLGIPFSSVVEDLLPQDVAVVEVSSFQLLRCEQFHPHIGVLLNLGANHLDRHPDTRAYAAAKARLFQCQTAEDWAVLNGQNSHVLALGKLLDGPRRVWFGDNQSNPHKWKLAPQTLAALAEGAQATLQVGRILGIPDPLIWQVIRSFRGLEHRLESVATIRGIHFVNDSKSTTVESLLFALKHTPGDLVVILGGRDKGMDFSSVPLALSDRRIKGVVLIGEARQRIRRVLEDHGISYTAQGETARSNQRTAISAQQSAINTQNKPPFSDDGILNTDDERQFASPERRVPSDEQRFTSDESRALGFPRLPSASLGFAERRATSNGSRATSNGSRAMSPQLRREASDERRATSDDLRATNHKRTLIIRETQTLEEAISVAASIAQPGSTVLFSPACASFDMFQDFEARGRAFKTIVHCLDKIADPVQHTTHSPRGARSSSGEAEGSHGKPREATGSRPQSAKCRPTSQGLFADDGIRTTSDGLRATSDESRATVCERRAMRHGSRLANDGRRTTDDESRATTLECCTK